MHILLTGGTGLIGKHLCQYWLGQGHRLTVWSRRPEQVPKICGTGVRSIARLEQLEADDQLDAVIDRYVRLLAHAEHQQCAGLAGRYADSPGTDRPRGALVGRNHCRQLGAD